MRAVPHAARPRLSALAAAGTLALGLGLGACGGGKDNVPGARPTRFFTASDLQAYNCADWERARPSERRAVLAALKGVLGGDVIGEHTVVGKASVLKDEIAYQLFDDRCAPDYAGSFRLYKLYGFAAGFTGVAQ